MKAAAPKAPGPGTAYREDLAFMAPYSAPQLRKARQEKNDPEATDRSLIGT